MMRKKVKISIQSSMIIAIIILLMSGCGWLEKDTEINREINESEREKLKQLNEMADQAYIFANEGKVEEARAVILKLSEHVTTIRFADMTSVEGIKALSETVIATKEAFTTIHYSREEGILAIAKLRLATDALTHPKHPMWLSYYKNLLESGKQLQEAIQHNNKLQSERILKEIIHQYSIIRPAVLINREPYEVNKMDTYLKYLSTNFNPSVVAQYESVLSELFHHDADTAYLQIANQSNPTMWTITIGMIIISVLSYVGWKKYQYEKVFMSAEKQRRQRGMF